VPGTLYLLCSNADPSLHKIGITNHWHQRAKQLEVGLSTACVGRWLVNNNRQLESFLHRRFKAHRLPQSEWFHLSPDQVQWVVSAASKAADDLKQATNHQPPQPVVYRHPGQPTERPRPHTYQPDPAPAARPRPAPQAKPKPSPAFAGHFKFWLAALSLLFWFSLAQQVVSQPRKNEPPAITAIGNIMGIANTGFAAVFAALMPSAILAGFTGSLGRND
jgi:hypothetical protein